MRPLVLSSGRWQLVSSPELALLRFHSEFASEIATLPKDFGARVPLLHAEVPEELRPLWRQCAAKEWLWQTAVANAEIPLPPHSPLLQERLFGPDQPPLSAFVGRRAAVAVIPLHSSGGQPRTMRLWCFEKSPDLPATQQKCLPGAGAVNLGADDRIFCANFPAALEGESWQLGASLAFQALRDPELRHGVELGRHWIVTGDLDREGCVLRVDPASKPDLLNFQPWTRDRSWLWPVSNREAVLDRFPSEVPAFFVQTIKGGWARLQVADDAPGRNAAILRYLFDRRFQVIGLGESALPNRALDTIALFIAFEFSTYEPLISAFRTWAREKDPVFGFHAGSGKVRQERMGNMCYLLRQNGIIKEYTISIEGRISGRLCAEENALAFITGGWMERCVRVMGEQFLNLQPARIGCLQNVQVHRPDGRVFEMDTLLMVDDELYWLESKSGDYTEEHIQRYAQIAKELDLDPTHVLLVASNLNPGPEVEQALERAQIRRMLPSALTRFVEKLEMKHSRVRKHSGPTVPQPEAKAGAFVEKSV